jgi:hypothetical protein
LEVNRENLVRELAEDGWLFRKRELKGAERVIAYKTVKGNRRERYVGTHDESMKRILRRFNIDL